LGGHITLPKNTLVAFPGLENTVFANRFVIGEPLSIVKLYALEGVDTDTGLFTFKDFNGDGEISSPEDRQFIADLTPTFFGGVSNTVRFGNWGLDFLLQFVKKDGYNQYYLSQAPGTMNNQPIGVLDLWQEPGDQAFMQQATTGGNFEAFLAYSRFSQSSGAVSDASFVRLKTLELSYELPLDAMPDTSCRISVNAQNLLTFTRFKGGDPEQTLGYLPPLRRMALNLQLHF
jgi:hypothetical protein